MRCRPNFTSPNKYYFYGMLSKKITLLLFFLTLFLFHSASSQTNRINTHNNIGWYAYFGTTKLSFRISLHTEYQWRRNNFITGWQQSLLRLGMNYQCNPNLLLRVGYAWVETFPYGEYALNAFNRDYTEHRIFEMIQLSQKQGILDLSHRFMLEQRFVGTYSSPSLNKEDAYPLLNRIRYLLRMQVPIAGREIKDRTPYINVYDEIFLGFGKNVNNNVFDQNRIGALFGYRWSKNIRLEAGFLSQILQLGRQINSRNVFQYNNGIIINALVNLDLKERK